MKDEFAIRTATSITFSIRSIRDVCSVQDKILQGFVESDLRERADGCKHAVIDINMDDHIVSISGVKGDIQVVTHSIDSVMNLLKRRMKKRK
jgi:hypothetical protein